MARATERTGPAILSAGAIVIVAMLVLALADFNATREMGPILALGIAVMVVAGLTLLPAILGHARPARVLAGGPAGAGPSPPVSAAVAPRRRAWSARGPAATAAVVTAILVVGALGSLGGREPLDFSEAFREAARVGARRAADLRALHPRPRRAAERRHRRRREPRAVISQLTDGPAPRRCRRCTLMAASVPPDGQESELALSEAYLKLESVLGCGDRHGPRAAPRARARRPAARRC